MTENEAKEVLQNFDMQVSAKADGAYQSTIGEMACKVAVKSIEELEQYRSIGTVSECREAAEKQRAKKPNIGNDNGRKRKCCSLCGCFYSPLSRYCTKCGQAILREED